MPSVEPKRPKRPRSAKIDTTEDLTEEWLTPKNNPVMQGLVSFLNIQPGVNPVSSRHTVGSRHTVSLTPTVAPDSTVSLEIPEPSLSLNTTVSLPHTEIPEQTVSPRPTVGLAKIPDASISPRHTVGLPHTVRPRIGKHRAIVRVTDALSLASRTLLTTMFGKVDDPADVPPSRVCKKGYTVLATEAGIHKMTVKHLIAEFRHLGIVEIGNRYNPDTKESNSYTVNSFSTIRANWQACGITHYIPGRKPILCNSAGEPITYPNAPTVSPELTVPLGYTVRHPAYARDHPNHWPSPG